MPAKPTHRPKVEAYYRLSQDDPDAHHPLDVRIASRIATIKDLAARYSLTLHDEDIHTEVESGGTISKRPKFAALLDRCERGLVSHLLTPYQHRLSRGDKRDEADVEDALISGAVKLVTQDGVTDFGDANYDPLPYEVRALVARQQRRDFIKATREAKQQNIKNGQNSGGATSYGYRWIKPAYDDDGNLLTPGHFRVIPAEYAIVEELFRRIRAESLKAIGVDFNQRLRDTGLPLPPGRTRAKTKACKAWYLATLRDILLNPFYAGYPASRERILRNGKKISLPHDEWIMPKEPQTYRHPDPPPGHEDDAWHPTTLAEQAEIEMLFTRRNKGTGQGKVMRDFLATGLLFCVKDRHMSGSDKDYRCNCHYIEAHPGMLVRTYKIHAVLFRVLEDVIAALPETFLTSKPAKKTAKDTLRREYETAQRAWEEAKEDAEDLMQHRRRHIAQYGEDMYKSACAKNSRQMTDAKARMEDLRAQLETPDVGEMLPLLQRVHAKGVAWYWERWTAEEKRQALASIIKRLDLIPPAQQGQHSRAVRVTLHDWTARYCKQVSTHPLPKTPDNQPYSE